MEGLIISIIVAVLALSKVAVNVFQSISTTKTLQNRNADVIVETRSGKKIRVPGRNSKMVSTEEFVSSMQSLLHD